MKIIIILIGLVCNISLNSQNLKYYRFEQTKKSDNLEKFVLYPIDKIDSPTLFEKGWRHTAISMVDHESLGEAMKTKFSNLVSSLTAEEKEVLKSVTLWVYLDLDLQIATYKVNVKKELFSSFGPLEKRVYDFLVKMNDMSFIKKHCVIPDGFTGTIYTLSLRNYL